jgi:hypothetical protein
LGSAPGLLIKVGPQPEYESPALAEVEGTRRPASKATTAEGLKTTILHREKIKVKTFFQDED